ncbi:MAG: helix-turn-helix domain-containing protein [Lachnospiraceae bacterium]|nr:helix-turn-helix domain-containing protein [Lachnospiraceae bacterium]
MNEKFFRLPAEKQEKIINAGYHVFAENSYRKSPMSEIAGAAGISKSLLFYYFQNKRELYLFLWNKCARDTMECLTAYGCYKEDNLFDMMYRGMQAKIGLMKKYPDMGRFVIKAFYEKDPEVCGDIQKSYRKTIDFKASKTLLKLDPDLFVPGLDLEMMYREMYWASEGYLWEMVQKKEFDVDQLEKDFSRMIDFWRNIYMKKEV